MGQGEAGKHPAELPLAAAAQSAAHNERMTRLQQALGPVTVLRPDGLLSPCPLIAVTSSRLGHDPHLHRQVCQFLVRCLLDCRQREASLLIALGSAIESWATRAAELFAVPIVNLSVNPGDDRADILVASPRGDALSRDSVMIALADRVDAVYVRRKGTVERCLRDRVERRGDVSTRVAVCSTRQCAASDLIAAGAIGWFHARAKSDGRARDSRDVGHWPASGIGPGEGIENSVSGASDSWARTDGQWLIHCTRRSDGAWPGETERQYRDWVLLGDESSAKRSALDALVRIVKSGQLVAGATATSKAHPVVCFSALPLVELLQRRCFRPQLGRWDYEPFGIAIRLSQAMKMGIQPVIYGQAADRLLLAAEDQFRFHPIGKTFDWREEREWRSRESVDLGSLHLEDVRVFAVDVFSVRQQLEDCRWPVTLLSSSLVQAAADVTNRGKPV